MDNFFGRLKVEMFYEERFESIHAFKKHLNPINNDRISLKLKGMSPVHYRTHSLVSLSIFLGSLHHGLQLFYNAKE